MAKAPATVQLVCIKPFGTYKPGDLAAEVSADARYLTDYFAPIDHPVAAVAVDAKAALKAELEAELAALEGEN